MREGWVRTVEKLLALGLASSPVVEDKVIAALNHAGSNETFTALWTDQDDPRGLLQRWRSSSLARHLNLVLPALEQLPPQKIISDRAAEAALMEMLETANFIDDSPSTAHVSNVKHSVDEVGPSLPTLPSDYQVLLDEYLTFTHSWMPVIETHTVYRMRHHSSRDPSTLASPPFVCLSAILACAESNRKRIPTFTSDANATGSWLAYANGIITQLTSTPELQHAQAALLLSIAHIEAGDCIQAWYCVGQATRMVLLCKQNIVIPSPADASTYSRTLFAVHVIDVILSAALHTVPHLRDEDISSMDQIPEDNMDEWNLATGLFQSNDNYSGPVLAISKFNALVCITRIFSKAKIEVDKPDPSAERLNQIWDIARIWKTNFTAESDDQNTEFHDPCEPAILPNSRTVHMVYLLTLLLTSQNRSTEERDGLHSDTQGFFDELSKCLDNWKIQAVPAIWGPILDFMFETLEEQAATGSISACTSIHTMIWSVSRVDALLSLPALRAFASRRHQFRGSALFNPGMDGQLDPADSTSGLYAPPRDHSGSSYMIPSSIEVDGTAPRTEASNDQYWSREVNDVFGADGIQIETSKSEQQDTVYWNDSWDQSLLNLGFTDADDLSNLQSIFHSFNNDT